MMEERHKLIKELDRRGYGSVINWRWKEFTIEELQAIIKRDDETLHRRVCNLSDAFRELGREILRALGIMKENQ